MGQTRSSGKSQVVSTFGHYYSLLVSINTFQNRFNIYSDQNQTRTITNLPQTKFRFKRVKETMLDRTLPHVVDFSDSCPSSSLQGSMWRVTSAGTQILFITFWNTVRSNDMNPKSINSAKEFELQFIKKNKKKETNVEWKSNINK